MKKKKPLKIGQQIAFILNKEIIKGEVIGVPMDGKTVAVKYGMIKKCIINSENVIKKL